MLGGEDGYECGRGAKLATRLDHEAYLYTLATEAWRDEDRNLSGIHGTVACSTEDQSQTHAT